jgi:mxaK protein
MALKPAWRERLLSLEGLDRLGTPRRTRAAWRAVALLAVVALAAALSWALKARDNAVIIEQRANALGDVAEFEKLTPELLAAAEQLEPALARYRALYGHTQLGAAARYNSANLLLRNALALRESDATSPSQAQALPLVELAKQGYRQALRADPSNWDARYNFERAQRVLPDPDDTDAPIPEPRAQAERSPTTSRGIGGGLP